MIHCVPEDVTYESLEVPRKADKPSSDQLFSLAFASLANNAATCLSRSESLMSNGIPAAALTRLFTTLLSDMSRVT